MQCTRRLFSVIIFIIILTWPVYKGQMLIKPYFLVPLSGLYILYIIVVMVCDFGEEC